MMSSRSKTSTRTAFISNWIWRVLQWSGWVASWSSSAWTTTTRWRSIMPLRHWHTTEHTRRGGIQSARRSVTTFGVVGGGPSWQRRERQQNWNAVAQPQRHSVWPLWDVPPCSDVLQRMNSTDAADPLVLPLPLTLLEDDTSQEWHSNKNNDKIILNATLSTTITTTQTPPQTPMTTMTSLGDIMNTGQEHDADPSSTLASKYGITNPLDRLLLTANGNLQRLVASYYDAPVTVVVQSCTPRQSLAVAQPTAAAAGSAAAKVFPPPPQIWDRCVQLQVMGRTFVTAQSVIVVHDPVCQQLVQSGTVGLGQLFRHLNLLPEFELHAARSSSSSNNNNSGDGGDGSRTHRGRLQWREYTLRCRELTCRIVETFEPHVWDMERLSES